MSNIQSNSSSNTKTVLYYGKEIQVPHKAKWIHTDSNGRVYWSVVEFERLITYFTYSGLTPSMYNECTVRFNHTEMSSINWMLSQKCISDLPSVCTGIEQVPHPHADLMLKYAQIAQYSDKPWEELQFKGFDGTWLDCTRQPQFKSERQYRLKPQQVQIQVGQVWESSKTKVKFSVVNTDVDFYTDNLYVTLNHSLDVGLDIPYTVTEDTLRKHFQLVK